MKYKDALNKFKRRLKQGQTLNTLYLSYYYIFLSVYDFLHKKNFSHSQAPDQVKSINKGFKGGTGNFPAHPLIVRKLLKKIPKIDECSLCDIGSGSGIILYEATMLGFYRVEGVEIGTIPAEISKKNLGNSIKIRNQNAFDLDYNNFDVVTFFRPFGGDIAKDFFKRKISKNIKYMIIMNFPEITDKMIELGFKESFHYRHPIYKNFTGGLWQRKNQ